MKVSYILDRYISWPLKKQLQPSMYFMGDEISNSPWNSHEGTIKNPWKKKNEVPLDQFKFTRTQFCTQIGVILKADCSFVFVVHSVLPIKLENNKSAGLCIVKACSWWFCFRCYMGQLSTLTWQVGVCQNIISIQFVGFHDHLQQRLQLCLQ